MDKVDKVRRRAWATIAATAVSACLASVVMLAPGASADETPSVTDTTSSADPTPSTSDSSTSSTTPPDTTTSSTSSTTPPDPPSTSSVSSTSSPRTSRSTTPPPFTTTTGTRPGSPPPAPPGSGDEPRLSAADLAAQIAQAGQLRATLAASNSVLAAAISKLDDLAKQSNQLLDKLAQAREAELTAQTTAKDSEELSARLDLQLATEKQRLRAWAFYAYSEGGSAAELVGIVDAMGQDPSQAGNPMGDLSYLTDVRAQTYANIQTLQLQQADATYQAEVAQKTAEQAATDVVTAKAEVDKVLTEQKTQLTALRASQASEIAKAGPLVGILAGARSPEAIAAYKALLAELMRNGQSIGSVGALCSKDENTYPNGMLPATALCPLWMAPGESLRPRAAAAFNAMSAAYAKQTGHPICVTDSYRSLGEQYSVKASRGIWAATPGFSPHGLGIALDLCGGINSFGTPAHEWMQQNGPLYGWYHPAWAEPTGSLPEPWHWQFAG